MGTHLLLKGNSLRVEGMSPIRDSLVKWSRRHPLTVESGVRLPYGLFFKGYSDLKTEKLNIRQIFANLKSII